jgi:hypothetical protein
MRGGNLAFAKFSWANFAIRSFRIIYSSFFLFSKSTEQNQGMGFALKVNYSRSSFVFLFVFRDSKLNGF